MAESKRGFAALSPEKLREIARKGGMSVPNEKRAFNNRELAQAAGRKGGAAEHRSRWAKSIEGRAND
jgi:general stress protein YciG